jgi:uncharacterized protein (TIGR00251 family)
MNIYDVSRVTGEGVAVDIIVSPRSSRSGPDGFDEWRGRLIVRVRAPPLDGKANKEVEDIFGTITGCRSEITSGHLNRQKTVTVYGDTETIMKRLGENA